MAPSLATIIFVTARGAASGKPLRALSTTATLPYRCDLSLTFESKRRDELLDLADKYKGLAETLVASHASRTAIP
jgi:hypothetical protein